MEWVAESRISSLIRLMHETVKHVPAVWLYKEHLSVSTHGTRGRGKHGYTWDRGTGWSCGSVRFIHGVGLSAHRCPKGRSSRSKTRAGACSRAPSPAMLETLGGRIRLLFACFQLHAFGITDSLSQELQGGAEEDWQGDGVPEILVLLRNLPSSTKEI